MPPPAPSPSAQNGFSSADGAVYKGLAMATDQRASRSCTPPTSTTARIDVFDCDVQAGRRSAGRVHRSEHAGGVRPVRHPGHRRRLFVTYAKQDAAKHDDVAGAGQRLRRRLRPQRPAGEAADLDTARSTRRGAWRWRRPASARSPTTLLVGNFGDGAHQRLRPEHGALPGRAPEQDGPIAINGLWGLRFGNGVTGTPQTLLFTAGIDDENHGLMGEIKARRH